MVSTTIIMGAWGYSVKSDDTVLDVLDTFNQYLKQGATEGEATRSTLRDFADLIGDPDDEPLLWLGLAEAQWTYGMLDPVTLDRVRQDVARGAGLERWAESPTDLAKRQQALATFIAKVEQSNPRPRKRPRIVVRPPEFEPGTCLAIRGRDGFYRAAIVLVADHTNVENGQNLIALLDYHSADRPGMGVFEQRRWSIQPREVTPYLRATHGLSAHEATFDEVDASWYPARIGFRSERERFEIIGQITVRADDPQDTTGYAFPFTSWKNLGR